MSGAGGQGERGRQRERDEQLMRRCLELARRAEGRTAPNPMVGCVVTDRRGRVVAEGFHRRAGEAHAEAMALGLVGGRAPGGTLYVNLEPCRHRNNRRTSPCAPLVAESGVARVVVGMTDPIRSHGGGAAWLARQGIAVERGVLRRECEELNRAWLMTVRAGRPLFTLKAAVTLDGKVATRRGESQWITGPAARRDGHALRNRHDAVLVGVGTALADDPELTVRGIAGGRDPVRVVLDSSLRLPPGAKLVSARSRRTRARVIVATTGAALATRERRLTLAGVEVWRLPDRSGRVDVAALARRLAEADLTSVLVEGGPSVHGSLLEAGLADELRVYLAPLVVGGHRAPSWAGGSGVARLAQAHQFVLCGQPETLGPDLALTFRPRRRP